VYDVTHLRFDEIFNNCRIYCKFPIEYVIESILKIGPVFDEVAGKCDGVVYFF